MNVAHEYEAPLMEANFDSYGNKFKTPVELQTPMNREGNDDMNS